MANARSAARRTTEATETARTAFAQVNAASADAMRDNVDRSMAAISEFGAFGKQNVEAMVASAAVAQKGFETLSARAVAYSKNAMENHVAAAKSLMTAKSVQELVERQTAYARSSFDAYVAELNSLSDVFGGVAKEAMKPLNERMSAVSHLMQTGAAR